MQLAECEAIGRCRRCVLRRNRPVGVFVFVFCEIEPTELFGVQEPSVVLKIRFRILVFGEVCVLVQVVRFLFVVGILILVVVLFENSSQVRAVPSSSMKNSAVACGASVIRLMVIENG